MSDPAHWSVAELDDADEATARAALLGCCSSDAWVDGVLRRRPLGDEATALDACDAAMAELSTADLEQALAGHPRIGDRVAGADAAAAHSRREQSSMTDADTDVRDRLLAGNVAYEQRFDRVFLIRAAGRSPEQMLTELERRLEQDDETELAEVREQLRQITRLRLEQLLESPEEPMRTLSTHVLDAVTGEPARGVAVAVTTTTGEHLGAGTTDDDGRVGALVPQGLPAGDARIVFATGPWFADRGVEAFYPEVSITFTVAAERHYHVPLLLSPFAFSTYRGS